MSKAYTETDFSDQMDRDLSWRIRELSDIKSAIRRAESIARPALLRALLPILYAHWEGYIRFCAIKYFEHIVIKKLPYNTLIEQFYINSFLVRLDAFFRGKGSVSDKTNFLRDVMRSHEDRLAFVNDSLIDTKSNFNTDVIKDICLICAVSGEPFESERGFIDGLLLKRRNQIAHGENEFIREDEIDELIARTTNLMRAFRNSLENNVYSKAYVHR